MRNYEPPVYNPRRLYELPIPNVGDQSNPSNSIATDNSIAANDSDDEFEQLANYQLSLLNEEVNIATDEPSIDEIDETNNNAVINNVDPLTSTSDENGSQSYEIPNTSCGVTSTKNQPSQNDQSIAPVAGEILADVTSHEDTPNNYQSQSDQTIPQIVAVESLGDMKHNEDTPNDHQSLSGQTVSDPQIATVANLIESTSERNSTHNDLEPLDGAEKDSVLTIEATCVNNTSNDMALQNHQLLPTDNQNDAIESTVDSEQIGNGAYGFNSDLLADDNCVKVEYIPFNVNTDNNAAIDEILDESEVVIYGENEDGADVIMKIGPSGFPMPLPTTTDSLVKRENDRFSGNIPYNITVTQSLKFKALDIFFFNFF